MHAAGPHLMCRVHVTIHAPHDFVGLADHQLQPR
jgi:hypothetical protein